MNLNEYIETVSKRFLSGISREHSYRADLEALIRELVIDVEITNEPANVTDCGNPDYVITKSNIPIGFIEAKDIGKDLKNKTYKPQFDRYRKALDNLIITDYLWFQFFQDGEMVHEIRIADIQDGKIQPLTEHFEEFANLIRDFCTYIGNTIKSPKKLAGMMAGKARLLQVILEKAITSDEQSHDNTALQQQYATFKDILIHDLEPSGFADIYAQTLAYGMFAARLHDDTLATFSRQEAAERIPKSNPFLRKLFNHVAGADIDERIKTTVDNLADVFRATDVRELLKNFGKSTQTTDPIIHFYETFLAQYDPKLRKARGVWYTPEPVVSFIVRGVDEILKTEFGLKDGLADTSKTTVEVEVQGTAISKGKNKGKTITQTKEVHRVQVLDPATGTGTFLAEVVKFIYNGKFKAMQGAWSGYVDEHLIPRLNGFELLMASYAMAHLKLDLLLRETGFKATKEQRLNIYLTNSLEEHHPDTGTLFSSWLSSEANEANHIKRDTPVMVVMGNPPYSVSSSNKSQWIQDLLVDYKKDLNERNIQPLSDDYIKFIRYGQHFIEKNGEGILAYISNNSFIDGIIHRQMRKHLLESFDMIYIVDLHGNSKKKEATPDGSKDENVFDIMQGVSINFFVKNKITSSNLAEVNHLDLYGKRKEKYHTLQSNTLASLSWQKIENRVPECYFVPRDFKTQKSYKIGFSLPVLFPVNSSGIKTHRDNFVVDISKDDLIKRMRDFFNL
ncbi:MAG: N-6 DNA methylase, partial [Mariprofundaceae bacterium]